MELRDALVEGIRQIALCHSYFVTLLLVIYALTEIVLLFAPTLFFAKPLFPLFTRQCTYRKKCSYFSPKKAIIVVFHVSSGLFSPEYVLRTTQFSIYHGNPIIVFLRSHHTFEELSGQSSYW